MRVSAWGPSYPLRNRWPLRDPKDRATASRQPKVLPSRDCAGVVRCPLGNAPGLPALVHPDLGGAVSFPAHIGRSTDLSKPTEPLR